MPNPTLIAAGRRALEIEARAVAQLLPRVDDTFVRACELILAASGRVVVSGLGKSGLVGQKIAATLASTGTPAFFVHPAEASHGDLGMVMRGDVLVAISNSGETPELLLLLAPLRRLGVPVISLTGNPQSTLAREAAVHIDVSVTEEACPLNLAPTASTTAVLAMGDALATALPEAQATSRISRASGWGAGPQAAAACQRRHAAVTTTARARHRHARTGGLLEMRRKGLGMTRWSTRGRPRRRVHRRRPAARAGSHLDLPRRHADRR
jgi:arabinose-5-phosphate isomerase